MNRYPDDEAATASSVLFFCFRYVNKKNPHAHLSKYSPLLLFLSVKAPEVTRPVDPSVWMKVCCRTKCETPACRCLDDGTGVGGNTRPKVSALLGDRTGCKTDGNTAISKCSRLCVARSACAH